jgi:Ca2+-binding RTX toxin-like protein
MAPQRPEQTPTVGLTTWRYEMNGIDERQIRGTVAGRRLRTGRRVVAGAALVAGALLGLAAQPAYATPGPTGDLTSTSAAGGIAPAAVVMTCGGLTEAAAQAAGYTIRNNAASPTAVIVVGTPGPDWMVGSAFNDILDGQGDDDIICGRNGADDLRGLSGNDTMFGGNGNDRIDGGVGTDVANGGNDNDTCTAETQNSC